MNKEAGQQTSNFAHQLPSNVLECHRGLARVYVQQDTQTPPTINGNGPKTHQSNMIIHTDDPLVRSLDQQLGRLDFFYCEDYTILASHSDGNPIEKRVCACVNILLFRSTTNQSHPEASAAFEAYSTWIECIYLSALLYSGHKLRIDIKHT